MREAQRVLPSAKDVAQDASDINPSSVADATAVSQRLGHARGLTRVLLSRGLQDSSRALQTR